LSYSTGLLYASSLRALLCQARTDSERADVQSGIELASRLVDRAVQGQQLLVALEALLLRAQMYAVMGNYPASRADYASALERAEPEGFIGVFVEHGRPVSEALANLAEQNQLGTVQPDYVQRILAAFPGPQPAPDLPAAIEPAALVEPLTDREREVLGWMAQGLKYREIAARLYISLNTVRFHVKAIYGKLNVNNRTKAVERARRLQIL
jgi:LuxR family maltose regulon positive regulatory protein